MKKKAKAKEDVSKAEELEEAQEDHDFISRVLAYLPTEMKSGYSDAPLSDESDAEEETAPTSREERQAALREKLHAKLQALRARSGSLRAQKNIRKRLNKIEKRKQNQKQQGKGGAINAKINAVKTAKKQKMIERRSKGALPSESIKSKPVFTDEGKLVFSKFDFASSEAPETSKPKKTSLKSELHRAREKRQKKQQNGSEGGPDQEAWDTAMKKATGEKIRDDPKLIKKTIRRQQQKKKQSKKKWEERAQNEKQKKEDRQNKRMNNIQERRDQKKKKIVNKLKKKGRILPGF